MNKHIIIEIGTNTTKALRADYVKGKWIVVSDTLFFTRLGQDLAVTGKLNNKAMERNLDTIANVLQMYTGNKEIDFHIIATESLRIAANSDEFLAQINNITSTKVEILSGEKEGELAYRAATYPNLNNEESVIVLDIGGGSTEFTLGCGAEIQYIISLPIGAVKLTELCIKNDPVTNDELSSIDTLIDAQMNGIKIKQPIKKMIGVGGTITTLAMLAYNKSVSDIPLIKGKQFSLEAIQKQIRLLANLTVKERKKLNNMPTGRADIILAGSLILEKAMNKFGLSDITVSTIGVRHGYLYSCIKT